MSILSNILLVAGFAFLGLFCYSLLKLKNRFAVLSSLLCLTCAIYILGYAMELRAVNVEQIKFYLKMEYFGLAFIPVFWLMFSYKFRFNTNPSFKLTVAALIIPIVTLFLSSTNEYHNLYYANVSAVEVNGILIAQLTKGPWYYVFTCYSNAMLVFGIIVFYQTWRLSRYSIRTQSFWMLFGSAVLAFFSIIYQTGISPKGLDVVPFGFIVLAISYCIALFRYDLLEIQEAIRSAVFSEISEGIMIIDDQNRLLDFNNAASRVFPWLNIANIGTGIADFEEGKSILRNENNKFEILTTGEGHARQYEFRVTALQEKGKTLGSIYIFQDTTRQKDMMERLKELASYDSLTQVYNKRRLMEEAERELSRSKRYGRHFSVLMLDIDHFKQTNDQFGHLAGDTVLMRMVEECQSRLRETDIIGRYGGEEFTIILVETDYERAFLIAEDIRQKIASLAIVHHDRLIRITVSIGVASMLAGDRTATLPQLIDAADKALYRAKNNGRNRVSGTLPKPDRGSSTGSWAAGTK